VTETLWQGCWWKPEDGDCPGVPGLDFLDIIEVLHLLHIVVLFFEELYGACSHASGGGKVAEREPNRYTFVAPAAT